MKNKLTIIALLGSIMLGTASFAGGIESKKGGADIFDEKSILFNVGIGVPWFSYVPGTGYYAIPAISGALEFGVHKWVSVGPYVSFNSSGWVDNTYTYQNSRWYKATYANTGIAIGAKGSFHFSAIGNEKWGWNINTSKIDIYASAYLGVGIGINTIAYEYTNRTEPNGGGVGPSYGISAGIRYMFSPAVGVYAEVGPSPLGWASGGLTFKLK